MTRGMRTKEKKKNNVVILIRAENDEELKAIEEEFLLSAIRVARKRELGYYIAPVEIASFESVQNFADFSLEISTGNR